jgi:hypothetical protein
MGLGVYPTFNLPVSVATFDSDGKFLLAKFDVLDDVASAYGLRPLSSFADNRPIPEGFSGDPDELAQLIGPWDQWFPIADGIRTIDGLTQILRTNPESRSRMGEAEEVIEELETLVECLREAAPLATSFRLEVF